MIKVFLAAATANFSLLHSLAAPQQETLPFSLTLAPDPTINLPHRRRFPVLARADIIIGPAHCRRQHPPPLSTPATAIAMSHRDYNEMCGGG
jgi:hypothetical protein